MTAAIAHLMRPSLRTSLGGWPARVLTVLALVLPIPFCSALGLSLPLPATVARIAAKLVPLANSAVLNARDEQLLGARGSIVRFPGEADGNGGTARDAGRSATLAGPHNAGGGNVPRGKVEGSTTATPSVTANAPASVTANAPAAEEHGSSQPRTTDPIAGPTSPGGSTPTPDTGSTPPQGGSDPVPPSAPPTVVDTATAAATTLVGTASATATAATATVAATVAPTLGAVGGVAGSVLPPKKP